MHCHVGGYSSNRMLVSARDIETLVVVGTGTTDSLLFCILEAPHHSPCINTFISFFFSPQLCPSFFSLYCHVNPYSLSASFVGPQRIKHVVSSPFHRSLETRPHGQVESMMHTGLSNYIKPDLTRTVHIGGSDNFNVVFVGAGNIMFGQSRCSIYCETSFSIHLGSEDGPWNHSFRFEQ